MPGSVQSRAHGQGLTVRKEPRQARSKQMVDAILQAAAETFARHGYARATTNKIAERAGVSIGSLYQYFPNKDALLAGLLAAHHADVDQVVERSLRTLSDPAVPVEHGMRQFLRDLVGLHQVNPALTRALSSAVLRESPAAAAHQHHKQDEDLQVLKRVAAILAARPDVRDGDHTAMALIVGQITTHLTRWLVHDSPQGLDQDLLLAEMTELVVRYIKR